jgi:hypothetical protein
MCDVSSQSLEGRGIQSDHSDGRVHYFIGFLWCTMDVDVLHD